MGGGFVSSKHPGRGPTGRGPSGSGPSGPGSSGQGPPGQGMFGRGPSGSKSSLGFEYMLEDLIRPFRAIGRGIWIPVVIGAVFLWVASGVYIVGPGEVGVVRQFGEHVSTTGPGPKYRLPWPIQRADVVNMEVVRRAEIGYKSLKGNGDKAERVPVESLMLTGDENIVETQVLVQYRVKDAGQYLFRVRDPDFALRAATEVAIRGVVGNTTIDDALTVGRPIVEAQTRDFLQRLLDSYETGLHVLEVKLLVVDPPDEVKDAFHEVVRAFEDRERLVKEAEGYQEDILPKARGDAEKALLEAQAYKEQRTLRAQGEAERFLKVLAEYQKAEEVTRKRLYLETVEKVLLTTKKYVIDSKGAGGNLLQFLPIGDATPSQPGASIGGATPPQPVAPAVGGR